MIAAAELAQRGGTVDAAFVFAAVGLEERGLKGKLPAPTFGNRKGTFF